ncbi:MAG: hypothetical protein U0326_10485 [Polyangiales bacterium]
MSTPTRSLPPKRLLVAAIVLAAGAWMLFHHDDPAPPRPPPQQVTEAPPRDADAPTPAPPPAPSPPPASPDVTVVDAASDAGGEARSEVLRGPWGTRPGEFGRTTESEGNPEGPMSFAVAPDGTLAVLDQRNRRIQRFSQGRPLAPITLENEAAQDLALTPDGRVVALDRLGASTLTVFGPDGRAGSTIALRGGPISEGGAVTGVFADAQGVYVEREHREVVRVADAEGHEDTSRPTLWGRPTRDGGQLLRAAIEDRARGVLRVSVAARSNGAMDWSTAVPAGAPVLYLAMLDSDARGRVYVAAETGVVSAEGPRDLATFVARLDRAGVVEVAVRLPPLAGGDEVFRPMSVDDEGAVYVMDPSREGLVIARYALPQ